MNYLGSHFCYILSSKLMAHKCYFATLFCHEILSDFFMSRNPPLDMQQANEK